MKLKKDYIPGLGDTLDFCIVGAGFDATRARDGIKAQQNVKWNTWHIGCLENKHQVVEEVES
jgi:DNA ligase-4